MMPDVSFDLNDNICVVLQETVTQVTNYVPPVSSTSTQPVHFLTGLLIASGSQGGSALNAPPSLLLQCANEEQPQQSSQVHDNQRWIVLHVEVNVYLCLLTDGDYRVWTNNSPRIKIYLDFCLHFWFKYFIYKSKCQNFNWNLFLSHVATIPI